MHVLVCPMLRLGMMHVPRMMHVPVLNRIIVLANVPIMMPVLVLMPVRVVMHRYCYVACALFLEAYASCCSTATYCDHAGVVMMRVVVLMHVLL